MNSRRSSPPSSSLPPYAFDLSDDFGVWVVIPKRGGRFSRSLDADREAAVRNFEGGVTDAQGRLLAAPTRTQLEAFERIHLRHPDCTCAKFSKHTLDRALEGADGSPWLDKYHDFRGTRKGAKPAGQGAS
jgi:hypothetical protein